HFVWTKVLTSIPFIPSGKVENSNLQVIDPDTGTSVFGYFLHRSCFEPCSHIRKLYSLIFFQFGYHRLEVYGIDLVNFLSPGNMNFLPSHFLKLDGGILLICVYEVLEPGS